MHPEVSANILHKLLIIIAGRIRSTNKLVSEKTPWVEDLRTQLLNDKLTGLYNRTFLDDDLALLLPKFESKSSALIIKPDNFKIINDSFGHEAGDKSLIIIAETIKKCICNNDIAARYKGDEFAVILPDKDSDTAYETSELLLHKINNIDISEITEKNDIKISASIGIAVFPDESGNNKDLLKLAYDKMLKARNSGGNRIIK
jgi:diguanylate cyclase (GGDEF)-like protein